MWPIGLGSIVVMEYGRHLRLLLQIETADDGSDARRWAEMQQRLSMPGLQLLGRNADVMKPFSLLWWIVCAACCLLIVDLALLTVDC